jgi:hypothetical protein
MKTEGLGGNWISWPLYAQEETRKALELPETWEPHVLPTTAKVGEWESRNVGLF